MPGTNGETPASEDRAAVTLRIDRREAEEGGVILSLSGRITRQGLDMLESMLGREKGPVAIDLKGVLLLDGDAVQLLSVSEVRGIELRNCPAYVREWIARERAQTRPDPSESRE